MKVLAAASLLALLAPAAARAGEVRVVSREVAVASAREIASTRSPIRFNLVGLHWQGRGRVLFRTRSLGGRWSAWRPAAPEAEDLPDDGTREDRRTHGWHVGNPYWTGPSDHIAYRLSGKIRRLRAHFLWSEAPAVPVRTLSLAGSPPIISRLSWGANERIRRGSPQYTTSVRFAVVHHTAGSNRYSRSESAAIVRGIQAYHVKSNGWNDIAYNFLVDKYGQVFEGRFGGVTRNVVGAHAQGFNVGSVGVSLLGTYDRQPPSSASVASLTKLLAWRLDVAHLDPLSMFNWSSRGNPRFPAGTPAFLRTVSGHRDTGFTDCPGDALYRRIPSLARKVSVTGLPKLYAPRARGAVGGRVAFSGRLTAVLPWSVTVRNGSGAAVASGSGRSRDIRWTWDSATAPRASYRWTIAGHGIRPAVGRISGSGRRPPPAPPPAVLSEVSVSPAVITRTEGGSDFTTIRYRLGFDASVTATLVDPEGTTVATLFSEPRPAGRHSFRFTAATLPDGYYRIVIRAETTDGRVGTASAPLIVSRVLRAFKLTPALFSPNGDRVRDRIAVSFELLRRASVRLTVRRGARIVAAPLARELGAGRHRLRWGASESTGRIADGRYLAVLRAAGRAGRALIRAPFIADTTPPRMAFVARRPLRVVTSETATLTIVRRGKKLSFRAPAGIVSLPTTARHGRVVAYDGAGNRSRPLRLP
ncbi:MAG: N-acetylmuramoyl-L-alanine amidase [Actinomycetota bacterium]|nr:N-acetylmuramoyl-L-alanine amidase [Actinomycetota bacterium]